MKKERKTFCVVCGAKNRNRFQDTCDSICTRANYSGTERGKQIEIEIRAEWRKPIPIRSTRTTRGEIEYNRPYMVDTI